MSSTGVQQCDQLGPPLFALVLHPLIHKIRDNCKFLLHVWNLDDMIVVGDSREVARTLDIIREIGRRLSLDLNISVTDIFGLRAMAINFARGCSLQTLGDRYRDIVVSKGHYIEDLQWRVPSLPIRVGGLGLYSVVEAISYVFVAFKAQSWMLQDHILRDTELCGMNYDFDIASDGLRDTILNFYFSNFATSSPLKPNML
ncbi:hypothetical protein A2U01_0025604 [Trifolium medium]|uniref:Reverse transcriptase domain-containing protein n=1 Tax=Trifolium medium TaxID=97028 RepID=A0A392NXM2_9FABA|nr:hypothetical protein [Trifolium medium]